MSIATKSVSAEVMNEDDARWRAVERRDREADGQFVFGVVTTGVYCRPWCPSRRPRRENVRFFAQPHEAEQAGLRACLRCHPEWDIAVGRHADAVRQACEKIRTDPQFPFSLKQLAESAGLSPFHFQKTFKRLVGVSPKQFAESCRTGMLKTELRAQPSVTAAIYEAGYGSGSRVYEQAGTQLGMTPLQYRAGGKHVAISHAVTQTGLGWMMIGATDRGLCFLQFADRAEDLLPSLQREYPAADLTPMREPYSDEFATWMRALEDHLSGQQPELDLPLDLRATAFQTRVWRYLQSIPYGSVSSYAEVAAGIGQPSATRAVARACAANRVALVIPCHRVIRGSGEMAGYRWGMERKRALLEGERRAAAKRS